MLPEIPIGQRDVLIGTATKQLLMPPCWHISFIAHLMIASIRRTSILLLGLVAIASCSESRPTEPVVPIAPTVAASPDLLGGVVGGVVGTVTNLIVVPAVQRITPIATSITVSKTIGSAGGTLSIPAAGVTVLVPQGALASSTVITMTARAGYLVAYDFAPHGITFAKPLSFTQSLSGTNVTLLQVPFLKLGYYSDPSLLGKTVATVSELLGGTVNTLSWSFSSKINHFSGYIVTCGFE